MNRANLHLQWFLVIGYAMTLVWIAALYAIVPSPIWAMPTGIACVFGARASRRLAAIRRHLRGEQ